MRPSPILAASVLVLLIAASGCSSKSHPGYSQRDASAAARLVGPDASLPGDLTDGSASGFVPLDLGDRWRYRGRFTGVLVDDPDGTPLFDETDAFEDRITCDEVLAGFHYFASRRLYDDPQAAPFWTLYRQDRTGLYIRDNDGSTPSQCESGAALRSRLGGSPAGRLPAFEALAARVPRTAAWRRAYATLAARHEALAHLARSLGAPRGPAPGEIQELAYPLVPGRHWVIRADPRYDATVERAMQLRTAQGVLRGWSIRIRSEFFGADDVVHFFWGRAGFLGLDAALFAEVTDTSGNLIGMMRVHETQTLVELHLAHGGHGDVAVSPAAPPAPGRLDD